MKAIEDTIKFLEEIVIECEPNTGCGRCDDARKLVDGLKGLLNPINNDLHIHGVSNSVCDHNFNTDGKLGYRCMKCGIHPADLAH